MEKSYFKFLSGISVLLPIIILLLNYSGFANQANARGFGLFLLILFCSGILYFGIKKIRKNNIDQNKAFSTNNFIEISLSILLISTLSNSTVTNITTGLFVSTALIYCIYSNKIYKLNKVYLYIFGYAIFLLFGTIGTNKGFHFPQMTYSYYLIPIGFSCFRFSKKTLLEILQFFFLTVFFFLILSVAYWFYNQQYLNANVIEWLTKKNGYLGIPGYEYVSTWIQYHHPSFISITIQTALISGFYLLYKKEKTALISKTTMTLFCILAIFTELLLESRIGVLCSVFILALTALYYIKLRTSVFKISLIASVIIGVLLIIVFNEKVNKFIHDDTRSFHYGLAIDYIKEHIWWGVGYKQEAEALKQQHTTTGTAVSQSLSTFTYVHNQFLGNMIQFGIWGALVLIVFLLGLTVFAIKKRSYLLQLFLFFMFIFMLIEEPLYVQEGISRFLIFLCFFIQISAADEPTKSYSLFKRFTKSKSP